MSHVAALISRLTNQGVRFSIEGGDLQCRASRTVATQEVRDVIAANKPAIIGYLAAIIDYPVDRPEPSDIGPNVIGNHSPPPGCIASRIACRVLGPCPRHVAGRPCLVADLVQGAA